MRDILLLVCLLSFASQTTIGQDIETNEETTEHPENEATTPHEAIIQSSTQATSSEVPQKVTTPTTPKPKRRTCRCSEGSCKCCTGAILDRWNYNQKNRACVHITYEPDDFEFHYKLLFNERVLYQNKLSGKNPPPVCLPIRRFIPGTLCMKFTNVYMISKNIHGCLNLSGMWNNQELFGVAFDCFRIGANGVAIIKPEEGGGLPTQVSEEQVNPEDYDDSAR